MESRNFITKQNQRKISKQLPKLITFLSILGITIHLALRWTIPYEYSLYPLYIVLAFGGGPLVFTLARKLIAFEFSSDLLAGISIVTSVLLDQYLAGSLVVLMLSGGTSLENYAIRAASKVLEALAKRAPTIAHRKKNERLEEILVDKIAIGDALVVLPHEICPVDGDVFEGHGVMDEAFLTGEPFLISKAPGSAVLSGSINGDASLVIRATKLAIDSRYAKIMEVMRETEQRRPRIRRLADQLGSWYTPLSILIASLAWGMSGEAVRFLAVIVIATPCPLLIAIPVAIIGSISLSARRGILIKNPAVLEQFEQCRTMILDKTGTLTYGKPTLTSQTVYNHLRPKEILQLVGSLEKYSKHPLASAIIEKAMEEKVDWLDVKEVREPPSEGLEGRVDGHEVLITSRKRMEQLGQDTSILPQGSGLECVIFIDNVLSAHYRFHDSPRADSKTFIQHLFSKHKFKTVMIVSGDRAEEVNYLADFVGVKEVYANQSPEQKVQIVEKKRQEGKVAYLGDGINDAPALMAATVGIAFGKNSDITAEAAGAVVMDNSLAKVDEFLHISERMRRVALQSAIGGMALSIAGMLVAAFGFLPPVAGALAQEIIDIFAILNAIRTAWKPRTLTDMKYLYSENIKS